MISRDWYRYITVENPIWEKGKSWVKFIECIFLRAAISPLRSPVIRLRWDKEVRGVEVWERCAGLTAVSEDPIKFGPQHPRHHAPLHANNQLARNFTFLLSNDLISWILVKLQQPYLDSVFKIYISTNISIHFLGLYDI